MRAMAASGFPHTPLDRKRPITCREFQYGRKARTISSGDSEQLSTNADASDTSFLKGADAALTRPFLTGFNESVVSIYWVGLAVMGLAFVIACFFRVPALRERSALEEKSAAMESLG